MNYIYIFIVYGIVPLKQVQSDRSIEKDCTASEVQ